jgi:hypothetical protein
VTRDDGPLAGAVEGCGRVYEQPCVAGMASLMKLAYEVCMQHRVTCFA